MTASRGVALALAISIVASVALVVIYMADGSVELQGIALALALGGMGTAIVIWAVGLIDAPIEVEERHSFMQAQRPAVVPGASTEEITRRRFLARLLAGRQDWAAALQECEAALRLNPFHDETRALGETARRRAGKAVPP